MAADFGQKSLIDVDEDISYDDDEEEVGSKFALKPSAVGVCGSFSRGLIDVD